MSRILVLIDGYNYYHRLDDYQKKYNECVKWLNYRNLIESFLDDEDKQNVKVVYFSAIAEHRSENCQTRHKIYIKALKSANIEIILGKFKEKYITRCYNCKTSITKEDLKRHEEKNTDVNIAIKLLELAIQDQFDKCFILSSDNDFSSVIKRTKELCPLKQIIVCPPPLPFKNPRRAIYCIKELQTVTSQKPLFISWNKIKHNQFSDCINAEIVNPWQITSSSCF